MIPDMLGDRQYFIKKENGDFVELKCGKLELPKQDEYYNYSDVPFVNLSAGGELTFSLKFNKKSWYRIQKALGLIKPVYKKFKKGKRYVWKEIIL